MPRDIVNENELARDLRIAPHPSPVETPVVRVLREARAKIASEGNWCHYGAGDGQITFCAASAIKSAAGFGIGDKNTPDAFDLWAAGCGALKAQLPQRFMRADRASIPEFNDCPATTHADVLALFDRAIATAQHKDL